ncbi:hypothetical protein ACIP5T_03075 [Microbacterium sp. NPDC088619]|uniref:hypothetical protein n=1 Tax=Microbacterium sp. NPDC088619 TaxID=3364196 RepID=UPI00380BDDBE
MTLDLDALLVKAQEMVDNAEPELVPVVLAGQQIGVRFLPVSGADWRDLSLKHPPRSDVLRDLNVGYNIDALVSDYPNVALVDGESVDDMIREDSEGKSFSKWPAVRCLVRLDRPRADLRMSHRTSSRPTR